jgi:hypothetical protein
MIRYTVLWRKNVEDELARLWCDSPRRQDITAAADHIDAELSIDAHQKGTPLPGGKCITVAPLIAYFRVDDADRKVLVEAVVLLESN